MTRSIEDFLASFSNRESSSSMPFNFRQRNHHLAILPDEVRQAANRGWRIFPVSPVAKLMGNPDLLIGEATSDIRRLEELAAEFAPYEWRVAVGSSSLCIVQIDGLEGRRSFAALGQDQEECLTLQAHRGDAAWAFFRRPLGVVLRAAAKKLATGVRVLGESDSCVIPPSGGSVYKNPWADVEAVPYWLRELVFEPPDNPPGNATSLPAFSRPAPCRSAVHPSKPPRDLRNGYPVHGQAGWRGGFRISRRR